MNIEVQPAERPDHALVILYGADASAGVPSFIIARNPEWPEPYLGERGWQKSPATLRPLAAEAHAAGLSLLVGPDVCRHLSPELYRIEVPSLALASVVEWPYIPPQWGGRAEAFPPADPPAVAPPAAPRITVPPVSVPPTTTIATVPPAPAQPVEAPVRSSPSVFRPIPDHHQPIDSASPKEPVTTADPPGAMTHNTPRAPTGRHVWPIVGLAAVVAVAGIGYALWPRYGLHDPPIRPPKPIPPVADRFERARQADGTCIVYGFNPERQAGGTVRLTDARGNAWTVTVEPGGRFDLPRGLPTGRASVEQLPELPPSLVDIPECHSPLPPPQPDQLTVEPRSSDGTCVAYGFNPQRQPGDTVRLTDERGTAWSVSVGPTGRFDLPPSIPPGRILVDQLGGLPPMPLEIPDCRSEPVDVNNALQLARGDTVDELEQGVQQLTNLVNQGHNELRSALARALYNLGSRKFDGFQNKRARFKASCDYGFEDACIALRRLSLGQ